MKISRISELSLNSCFTTCSGLLIFSKKLRGYLLQIYKGTYSDISLEPLFTWRVFITGEEKEDQNCIVPLGKAGLGFTIQQHSDRHSGTAWKEMMFDY